MSARPLDRLTTSIVVDVDIRSNGNGHKEVADQLALTQATSEALIEGRGLAKRYQLEDSAVRALDGVDIAIDAGEFVAIMGPSGSGKSTLLSLLGAMCPPSAGELVVDGISVYDLSTEQRADFRHTYLGFVFQQLQLISYLSAIENVMLPLAISDKSKAEQREMAQAALEKVGLGEKADRLPNQLSGGEQGRVAVARAIVNQPAIILADEPTGSLDSENSKAVIALLRQLAEEGPAVIMVTHDPGNAAKTDRTIHIRDGRIVD
jgi:putative ABC transport system ATP-binding protein